MSLLREETLSSADCADQYRPLCRGRCCRRQHCVGGRARTRRGGHQNQALPAAQGTLADCLLALVPAYLAIEAAALRAGRNPDQPRGLSKVTETL